MKGVPHLSVGEAKAVGRLICANGSIAKRNHLCASDLTCVKQRVSLIAPLRFDARLFAPPPPPEAHQKGRPRVVGERLPDLSAVLSCPETQWEMLTVNWYGGTKRKLEVTTGTALWYSTGSDPLPIRWVLTRDPEGKREPKAYFSTDQAQSAAAIVEDFVKRWTLEVTYEESRAHLGVETQRQWADLAIERSTPCLLGLYSLVVLLGQALHPDGKLPIQQTAWYPKTQATKSRCPRHGPSPSVERIDFSDIGC